MGGRVSEEIIFGDITNARAATSKWPTAIARRMVCEWGMSEKMGMVEYGDHEDFVFPWARHSRARRLQRSDCGAIDQEGAQLLDDAYQLAKTTLIANRDTLEVIAKALLSTKPWTARKSKEIV